MTPFVWVLKEVVLAIHGEQLAEHGGRDGLRDDGLVDSALARPQNMADFDACDHIARLAAAYAYGICNNHGFVDGNKRTALVTAELFLALNGYELTASDSDCVIMMLSVADGTTEEEELIEWFQDNITDIIEA